MMKKQNKKKWYGGDENINMKINKNQLYSEIYNGHLSFFKETFRCFIFNVSGKCIPDPRTINV